MFSDSLFSIHVKAVPIYTSNRYRVTWQLNWVCFSRHLANPSPIFISDSWDKDFSLQLLNVPIFSPATCWLCPSAVWCLAASAQWVYLQQFAGNSCLLRLETTWAPRVNRNSECCWLEKPKQWAVICSNVPQIYRWLAVALSLQVTPFTWSHLWLSYKSNCLVFSCQRCTFWVHHPCLLHFPLCLLPMFLFCFYFFFFWPRGCKNHLHPANNTNT